MTFLCNPASLTAELRACERRLRAERIGARLRARDHTIWNPDATEIADRLGWLTLPAAMRAELPAIERIAAGARAAGLRRALLLGMGGSSLAPEVFSRVLGSRPGYLRLRVLDSTHPDVVRAAAADAPPERTLVIVATKSGGTVETISLFRYLYTWLERRLGRAAAQERVVAITDPGSGLEREARQLGAAHVLYGDPEVGGRYSALSAFGLAPAALMGVDVGRLLDAAAAEAAQPIEESAGLRLGALLGAAERTGRDKLTLRAPAALAPLGAWIEQLVAESTGKDGRGILPVDGEPALDPDRYPADRVFAVHRLGAEPADDLDALGGAGHPVAECVLDSLDELGALMYRWEIATAVAGAVIGINPFDQPNVEAAKVSARRMVDAYRAGGALPAPAPTAAAGGLTLYGDGGPEAADLPGALAAFLQPAAGADGGYVALHAYLPPTAATDAALLRLRRRILARCGVAVTCGYGPRFLHSTGQLHKGDAGAGSFIQLTADLRDDLPIPDRAGEEAGSLSFGVLIEAQALGDRQALLDAGRRVLRIGLGAEPVAGLDALAAAIR